MSTETLEKEVKEVKKPSEPLLSKKRKALLTNPLDEDNPITIQVLGICSALAVTVALKPTLVMAIAVTAVLVLANVVISRFTMKINLMIKLLKLFSSPFYG